MKRTCVSMVVVCLVASTSVRGEEDAPEFEITVGESSVTATDAVGDLTKPVLLQPFPNPRQGLTVSGKTATLSLPNWIFMNRAVANVGADAHVGQQGKGLPIDELTKPWVANRATTISEPADPSLPPAIDLLSVTRSAVTNGRVTATWRTRGALAGSPQGSLYYLFDFASPDGGAHSPASVAFYPLAAGGFGWFSTHGELGDYPGWDVQPYQDLKAAKIITAATGSIKFRVETAANLPAIPAAAVGSPAFTFILDYGRNGVAEVFVSFRFDQASRKWLAFIRKPSADGSYFVDVRSVAVTRLRNVLTASVPVADLGTGPLQWRVSSAGIVGTGTELVSGILDLLPNSGMIPQD